TQQETLSEFMNRRMAELGLGYKALTNAGIGGQTQQNIKMGIPFRMAVVTKEKLAKVLQCTIGDINAALSRTTQTTPFGEEVRKVPVKEQEIPSVMKTVDKLEQMVEEDYPELFAAKSGTNEEKSEPIPDKTDIKTDKSEPASSKTGIKADDFEWKQEQPKPKRKKIVSKGLKEPEPTAEKPKSGTVEEYRQKLKDMCLQQLSEADPFDADSTALFALIGQKLLKELMKK
ncbi:MAG: hypothetical protein IJR05_09830, partial [Acidaminococcaceae bacterium]|nr:hypothetical protein [Acidaminococcaceae bacterium]